MLLLWFVLLQTLHSHKLFALPQYGALRWSAKGEADQSQTPDHEPPDWPDDPGALLHCHGIAQAVQL